MIRAALTSDRAAVVALWSACGLVRPWNDADRDFTLALVTATSTVLVASDDDGTIVGSVMAGFDGHRGWVYYLAVAPAARRTGLGRLLMGAGEDWLRGQGAPKLQLMVCDGNEEALAFYAALGLERQPVVTLGRFLEAK
jgi:ribosomal protein S18 acetylase RimI-like enzyme